MVLQGGILSVLMIERVLVLAQALSEWSVFGVDEVVFCPIVLDRTRPR